MDINGQIKVSPTFENVIIGFDFCIGKSEYKFIVRLNRYTVTDVPQTFNIIKLPHYYTFDFTHISISYSSKYDLYDMDGRSNVKKIVTTLQTLNEESNITYRQNHEDSVNLTVLSIVTSMLDNMHKKLTLEDHIKINYQLHQIINVIERDGSLKNTSCKDLDINYDEDVVKQLEDRVTKGSNVNKVSQRVGSDNWIKPGINEIERFFIMKGGPR